MFIRARLECEKNHIPYRIYINNELMTERFYTIFDHRTTHNVFSVNVDAKDIDLKLVNLSDTEVKLVDWNSDENK